MTLHLIRDSMVAISKDAVTEGEEGIVEGEGVITRDRIPLRRKLGYRQWLSLVHRLRQRLC